MFAVNQVFTPFDMSTPVINKDIIVVIIDCLIWIDCSTVRLKCQSLTLYHTIPTFNDPTEGAFRNHCGKRRKCWLPAFSPFPTVFSTLCKREIANLDMFNSLPANAFNLVRSKILLFGKELSYFLF